MQKKKQQKEIDDEIKKRKGECSDKNHRNRINNMIRYLDSRKDFSFQSKEEIARELEEKMMMFMEDKMKKLIHAAKLKHNNYKSASAGD